MPALFTSTSIREKRSRAYVDETLRRPPARRRRPRPSRRSAGRSATDSSSARARSRAVASRAADEHPRAGRDVRACDLEPEAVAPSGDDRRSAGEHARHAAATADSDVADARRRRRASSRRKPFASTTIGVRIAATRRSGSTSRYDGPVGLDDDRRRVLRRLERRRAQREDAGEVVRDDCAQPNRALSRPPRRRRAPGRARPSSTGAGCPFPACRRAPRPRSTWPSSLPLASPTSDSIVRRAQCLCSSLLVRTACKSWVGTSLALTDLRQVVDVARQRSPCERGTRPEVGARPDPALGLQAPFDLGRVGADPLCNARELVRERDRQREEGVHAVLHELRRLDAHPFDPVREGAEQLLDSARGRRPAGSRRRSGPAA